MLRIQSGFAKGMLLESPKGLGTRPTSGKVRAAILNSLMPHIGGARVLDLCAGSGAMGLELLSRGAASCVFVENDRGALAALRKNLALMEARYGDRLGPGALHVVARSVEAVLSGLSGFDVVWADPPYRLVPDWAPDLAVGLKAALTPGGEGVVAVESDQEGAEALARAFAAAGDWSLPKQRNYGQTFVSIFEPTAASPA